MTNMQKKIIIFIILLFAASSMWLFHENAKLTDPNLGKNWWALAFSNPKDSNLNFTIENHSQKNNFHWEMMSGNVKIKSGDAVVANGAAWTSNVRADNFAGKIIIQVSSGSDRKEIYKSL